MRLLLGPDGPRAVDDDDLRALYTWPETGGVRANMVTTLDGSAVGGDGLSGSINTSADRAVFHTLRTLADCVLVGAGTARAEGYSPVAPTSDRPVPPPLVVVSRTGVLPERLARPEQRGRCICATVSSSGLAPSDDVWLCGDEEVDLPLLCDRLAAEGMPRVLTEGGPSLLTDLLQAGLVDELALTLAPTCVGDHGRHTTTRPLVPTSATLRHLLEADGTLIGLWALDR